MFAVEFTNDSGIVRSEYSRLRLDGAGSVSDPDALCWGRSCETEWPESLSSIGRAGKEKSTDAFRFRKGLLPEGDMRGDMRGDIFVGERLLFFGLLPWLLEASPVIPDSEYSRLLP